MHSHYFARNSKKKERVIINKMRIVLLAVAPAGVSHPSQVQLHPVWLLRRGFTGALEYLASVFGGSKRKHVYIGRCILSSTFLS